MKTRHVIKSSNLIYRSPISAALLLYLLFDKWNVPEWLWGVVGLLFVLFIGAWLIDLARVKEVDIFEDTPKTKSFKETLQNKE